MRPGCLCDPHTFMIAHLLVAVANLDMGLDDPSRSDGLANQDPRLTACHLDQMRTTQHTHGIPHSINCRARDAATIVETRARSVASLHDG